MTSTVLPYGVNNEYSFPLVGASVRPTMGTGMIGGHSEAAPAMVGGMLAGANMNVLAPTSAATYKQGMASQVGYVHQIPMNNNIMWSSRFFDPIFSAELPFDLQEFQDIVDEVNSTMIGALPIRSLRRLRIIMMGVVLVCFAILGFQVVTLDGDVSIRHRSVGSFFWYEEAAGLAVVVIASAVLMAECVMLCALACQWTKATFACRMKMSELNVRYLSKKVDFQLHEEPISQNYIRKLLQYSLVIQVWDNSGSNVITHHTLHGPALELEMTSMMVAGKLAAVAATVIDVTPV